MHKKYPYQSSHPRRRTSPSLRWASCAVSRQNMANECGKANAINRYKPTIWEQLIVSHIYMVILGMDYWVYNICVYSL